MYIRVLVGNMGAFFRRNCSKILDICLWRATRAVWAGWKTAVFHFKPWTLYWFSVAAIENDHTQGGWKQNKRVLPEFWRWEVWNGFPGVKHRCEHGGAYSRGSKGESIPGLFPASRNAPGIPWLMVTSVQFSKPASSNLCSIFTQTSLCVSGLPLPPS